MIIISERMGGERLRMTVIFIIFGMRFIFLICKWRSFIPIKEKESQAKSQISQRLSIPHRTRSRGRSEPPMNNGAIFVKRIAPFFLPVTNPTSRFFSFLDENWKPAHGSLLAAQPSKLAASARMESLSWRKYIFRQEVAAGFLRDLIYLTFTTLISWPK